MTMLGSRTAPRFSFRLLTLGLGLLAFAPGAPCHADGRPPPKRPKSSPSGIEQCAQVSASVRMEAYGFTHLVSLRNGCDRAVSCEVWTDVDPSPHHALRAAPGETQELITRRGSPAREVSAGSSCHYD
jgi:hypothetical protein